jgi:hypothetical protein
MFSGAQQLQVSRLFSLPREICKNLCGFFESVTVRNQLEKLDEIRCWLESQGVPRTRVERFRINLMIVCGNYLARRLMRQRGVVEWTGLHRTRLEQLGLIHWYLHTGDALTAYTLADQYNPFRVQGLGKDHQPDEVSFTQQAEFKMLRAVAAFRKGEPVTLVVPTVRTAYQAAEKWTLDKDREQAFTDFIVLRLHLGDLLFRIAKKWPDDVTVRTAPTLHTEPDHVLKLAERYLEGALMSCTGRDEDLAPKVRAVKQKHGLLKAV